MRGGISFRHRGGGGLFKIYINQVQSSVAYTWECGEGGELWLVGGWSSEISVLETSKTYIIKHNNINKFISDQRQCGRRLLSISFS